jgi:hypothetical protein
VERTVDLLVGRSVSACGTTKSDRTSSR